MKRRSKIGEWKDSGGVGLFEDFAPRSHSGGLH
jgi:hypothetical protein